MIGDPDHYLADGDFVRAARAFEGMHRWEEAVDSYARAGAYAEAGRLLEAMNRFDDAGRMLLRYLPVEPTPVRRLSAEVKREAMKAALNFARAGARKEAVGLLMNLGEHTRAASLLRMAGLRDHAVLAMRGESIPGSPWPAGVLFALDGPPNASAAGHDESGRLTGSRAFVPAERPAPQVGTVPGASPAAPAPDPAPAPVLREPSSRGMPPSTSRRSRRRESPPQPDPPSSRERSAPLRRTDPPSRPATVERDPLEPQTLSDRSFEDLMTAATTGGLRLQGPGPRIDPFAPPEDSLDFRIGSSSGDLGLAGLPGTPFGASPPDPPAPRRALRPCLGGASTHLRAARGRRSSPPRPPPAAPPCPRRRHPPGQRGPARFRVSTRRGRRRGACAPQPVEGSARGPGPVSSIRGGDPLAQTPSAPPGGVVDSLGGGDVSGSFGAPAEIREGSVLADRYRLQALIGAGGMARVYRTLDLELEEEIALKIFLQVIYDEDEEGLRRFRQEMKLSRKLIHPNIVRIYEFGAWRGARFITMELLHGVDLEAWADKHGGVLPPDEVLRLMIEACAGLQAAHQANVIHRDVKPSNFFIVDGGKRLKLMDFGVAKVQGAGQSLSSVDARIGTPRYMSPEQIQGGVEVGPPADLYGLGAVMYELLTGRRVFEEDDLVPLLLSHLSEPPTPLRRHAPHVPVDIEEIVMRLLNKDPGDRFSDCGELRKALLNAYVNVQRSG